MGLTVSPAEGVSAAVDLAEFRHVLLAAPLLNYINHNNGRKGASDVVW
jgi:hypothetical protein